MAKLLAVFLLAAVCAVAIWQITTPSAGQPGIAMIISYKPNSVVPAKEGRVSCLMQNCQEAVRFKKALEIQCPPDMQKKTAHFRVTGLRGYTVQVSTVFSPTSECQRKRWALIRPLLVKADLLQTQTSNNAF